MRNSWIALLLALLGLGYTVSNISSSSGDISWLQWCAAIGALICFLLAIFQGVKSIMHDLHREEDFPK